ncbi:MAG: AAA family ATPase [Verrucomicrobia bacterium]|nr:AAA family ATPase [Verrucomicrobiota bacterium]
MVDLSKYELVALRADGDLILYRGNNRDTLFRVLVVSPVSQRQSPESLRRLQNEDSLKEDLDLSWAARPIGMVTHWGRMVLALQDPGGVPLSRLLEPASGAQALDIAWALRLAINISSAIGAVHQRGIIHKDIKPAHILVNRVTSQCWLTGFGIASRLPRERQLPGPPEFIAGTLPYMAPEQTGRMNRSIDSRSDLYAFGVTLYEMLTGTLPFSASDPMEWVHCHIARQPVSPEQRSHAVPHSVSAIVMKLLAKTAEERYQTAAGVQADLRRCLDELEGSHPRDPLRRAGTRAPPLDNEKGDGSDFIAPFPLGQYDTPDRLRIPEKLYGRDREIDTLLASFERVVATGRPELVLVSGYSGIGKSSVVNELHKVLVPPQGQFASGKFDQYKRNIPYWTLAQAFQTLVRPLLAKSEAELSEWRARFLEALGPNGRLIVDLIPELQLIIGDQPAVRDLPPQDAKARFQLIFRRFVSVFARPEHPLALFLDDLQWLDAATLDFVQDLLTQPDVHHLMLIGAYRDNEVDSTHPLWRKLDTIRKTGASLHEIVLAPLTREDLGLLLQDALHAGAQSVRPLAHLIHEKTVGNPFFAIQFISALADEGLLTFNHSIGKWTWDVGRIQGKCYTDNVADLMVGKLNRLANETQKALQEFACLGNSAAVSTLSVVHGTSEERLISDLWQAERLEFIVRSEGLYKFAHDRVQEAAYASIPASSRPEEHLRIGRLLKAHTPPEMREQTVFEIVNQLNQGATQISSRQEREELAKLNLLAGKRAKSSTAYSSALKYLVSGAALLEDDAWGHNHELAFDLEVNRAECEFLTGQLAAAEERLTLLSSHIAGTPELATVACLRMDLYTTLDQSDRAVDVCLDYLRRVGVRWSRHPSDDEVRHEYDRIWSLLAGRSIEDLLDWPLMQDRSSFGTIAVLGKAFSPALFMDANLASLIICGAVNLSLEQGICDASCFAFAWLGMVARRGFGDYNDGFRFGQVGYDLVERRGLRQFEASSYLAFVITVLRWTKHIRASRDVLHHVFQVATRIGDLTRGAYTCNHLNSDLIFAGDPLPDVQREAEHGLEFARKARFGLVVDIITAQIGLIQALRGLTLEFGRFDDERMNEQQFEAHLSSKTTLAIAHCWYWIRKMQARYLAGQYEIALQASLKAARLIWTSPCFLEEAEYHFYSALSRSAVWDFAAAQEQPEHFEAITQHYQQLQIWAGNCPENFRDRAALVGAEIARIEDRVPEAMDLYEQAIQSAHENEFLHNEALANELAARFYLARGSAKIASTYLRDARYCYLRWGATGKVRQLEVLYPHLREKEPTAGPASTIGAPIDELDLTTVVKALQTLSGEIVLEKLIDTLMRMVIEHAGAQRGLLIFVHGDDRCIEAEAGTSGDSVIVDLRAAPLTGAVLPQSIVRYVTRTKESVILDDASVENRFSEDAYLRQRNSKSVLCLPLLKQATLTGMLYLENDLAPRVFTSGRLGVLKLLASQAAISLDNARLYSDLARLNGELTQENSNRKRAEEALRASEQRLQDIIDNTSSVIFVKDLELRYLLINREFERRHHVGRNEIRGKNDFDILPREIAAEVRANDLKVIEAGAPIQFEEILPSEQGNRCHISAKFLLHDRNGQPYAVCGIATDITERRQAEHALHQAQAEIARVSRMTSMEQLAASIAHEVNQPLAAVVASGNACLNWLANSPPNLRKAREAVERIVRDGNRASDVLKRVRTFLRKAPLVTSPLNVNEVIQEVLVLVGGELRKRSVEFSTEMDLHLPSVAADFVQLQQVLLNLVMNAIESMATITDRPRALHIRSHLAQRAGRSAVVIAVRDSGVGLTPQETVQVFQAFHSTKPEGMGMGLWICRAIIEAHGGQLTCHPNPDAGATFQFFLPVLPEESA